MEQPAPLPPALRRRVVRFVGRISGGGTLAKTASDVGRLGRSGNPEIAGLNRSCAARLAPALEAAVGGTSKPSPRGRKLRLSPALRSALRLQGQYMGHLRTLKPRQKAQVKALRATKGVRPAISLAKKLAWRSVR